MEKQQQQSNTSSNLNEYRVTVSQTGEVTIEPLNGKPEYVLVFIHGLAQPPTQSIQFFLSDPLKTALKNFKIVMPIAPVRSMTHHKTTTISWFDIKTYENSFTRPFEEVFSSETIQDSFKIIEAVVEREAKLFNNDYKNKVFLGGFSQGCGMSIYTAHNLKNQIAGLVGIAGYFFEITDVKKDRNIPTLIIHGGSDPLRPWKEVAVSYDKFIGSDKVIIVENMAHEMQTQQTRKLMGEFLSSLTNNAAKL